MQIYNRPISFFFLRLSLVQWYWYYSQCGDWRQSCVINILATRETIIYWSFLKLKKVICVTNLINNFGITFSHGCRPILLNNWIQRLMKPLKRFIINNENSNFRWKHKIIIVQHFKQLTFAEAGKMEMKFKIWFYRVDY